MMMWVVINSPISGYGASLRDELTQSWYCAGSASYAHQQSTDVFRRGADIIGADIIA